MPYGVDIVGARKANAATSFASNFLAFRVAGLTDRVFTAAMVASVREGTGRIGVTLFTALYFSISRSSTTVPVAMLFGG